MESERVFMLMFVDCDGQTSVDSVFTDVGAEERAQEVMLRKTAKLEEHSDEDCEDCEESYFIGSLQSNLSNVELNLDPDLKDIEHSEFVKAAYRELVSKGFVWIPLWINPGWLAHELRAQYDVDFDWVGRRMQLNGAGFTETP